MIRPRPSFVSLATGLALLAACHLPAPGPCLAGVPPTASIPPAAQRTALPDFQATAVVQAEPVWCWAACAQMIHAWQGREVSQTEIAERIHGLAEDGTTAVEAASAYEIMCALNPDLACGRFEALWEGLSRRLTVAPADDRTRVELDLGAGIDVLRGELLPARLDVVEDLRDGHPAVVGLRDPEDPGLSHLYVLCGATYSPVSAVERELGELFGRLVTVEAPDGRPLLEELLPEPWRVHEVELIDPYTAEVERFRVADIERRLTLVISRERARKHLQAWRELARVQVAVK